MKVAIVAEYYPRAADPTLGIWAHHQARAARDAGADVRVIVLYRPVPPLAAMRGLRLDRWAARCARPARRPLSPRRTRSTGYRSTICVTCHRRGDARMPAGVRGPRRDRPCAARLGREFPFELVHAHYAVPAGDAVRRAAPNVPLVVSVHGGDVLGAHANAPAVARPSPMRGSCWPTAPGPRGAATSAERARSRSCTSVPTRPWRRPRPRRADPRDGRQPDRAQADRRRDPGDRAVGRRVAAAAICGRRRWPERAALQALATSLGVADRVAFLGRLDPTAAVAQARRGSLFVLPSIDEAFGVAYVEAMAAGVPAIGCRGEDGPEEIAAAGGGIELVTPRDPAALASSLSALLSDPARLERMRVAARATRAALVHMGAMRP